MYEIVDFLAERAPGAVMVLAADRVVVANPVAARLWKTERKALLGKPAASLLGEAALERIHAASENPGAISSPGFEIRFSVYAETTCVVTGCRRFVVNGEALTVVFMAGGDSKSVGPFEEQSWQAQKMEALGTLAGGVAHDMNNILGAIMSLASVLRQDLDVGTPMADDLDDILAATRRGRDLTQNLLGFARKGKYRRELISLNHVSVKVQELLSRTIPKSIDWRLDLDASISPVRGDFGQLSHALMNIAINAGDAMPQGGTLTVSSAPVSADEAASETRLKLREEKYVCLSVLDSGTGMSDETVKRAFEPFFSTKEDNRGTGLGLAMVYGTVQNHGGEVLIESTPGQGTTVSVFLPAAKATQADKRTCPNMRAVTTVGTGRVLVVDDEELIRRSVKRVLETLGYEALLARDGRDAISVFESNRDVVLIILDLTMPVMDGAETYRRLRKIDPDVPVLLLSGHTLEGQAEELLEAGAASFVQKPFDLQTLSKGILESLPL